MMGRLGDRHGRLLDVSHAGPSRRGRPELRRHVYWKLVM